VIYFTVLVRQLGHTLVQAPIIAGSGLEPRRCRMRGGTNPGAPKGNGNAFKHGRYSAAAIGRRREVAVLIRAIWALACTTEEAT
jgi:hypothetical protein